MVNADLYMRELAVRAIIDDIAAPDTILRKTSQTGGRQYKAAALGAGLGWVGDTLQVVAGGDIALIDTGGNHYMHLRLGEDLSSDRNLTFLVGDESRRITLAGDPTLADWFDQDVRQSSAPRFARIGLGASADTSSLLYGTTDHATAPAAWLNQSSTGDAYTRYSLGSARSYAWGIDNSDDDKMVLSTAASGVAIPGTGNLAAWDTSGNLVNTGTVQATRIGLGVAPDTNLLLLGSTSYSGECFRVLNAGLSPGRSILLSLGKSMGTGTVSHLIHGIDSGGTHYCSIGPNGALMTLTAEGIASWPGTMQVNKIGCGKSPTYLIDAYTNVDSATARIETTLGLGAAIYRAVSNGGNVSLQMTGTAVPGYYLGSVPNADLALLVSMGASNFVIDAAGSVPLILATNSTAAITISASQAVVCSSTLQATGLSAGAALISGATISMGNTTSNPTSTPLTLNMGGTYANSAGDPTKMKLRLYDDTTLRIGFSVSSGSLEAFSSSYHNWYLDSGGTPYSAMRLDINSYLSFTRLGIYGGKDGYAAGLWLYARTSGGPVNGDTWTVQANVAATGTLVLQNNVSGSRVTKWSLSTAGVMAVDHIAELTGSHGIGLDHPVTCASTLQATGLSAGATLPTGLQFYISGTPVVFGDGRYNAEIYDSSAMAQGVGGGLAFSGSDGSYPRTGACIWAYKENGTSGNYAFGMKLATRPNGGNLTTALVIRSNGDVYSDAWTSYGGSSTITGWASRTETSIYYKCIGKQVFVSYVIAGTSNAASAKFTLPYTAAPSSSGPSYYIHSVRVTDNGTVQSTPGLARLFANSNTVEIVKSWASNPTNGDFTASGTKTVAGSFTYETV